MTEEYEGFGRRRDGQPSACEELQTSPVPDVLLHAIVIEHQIAMNERYENLKHDLPANVEKQATDEGGRQRYLITSW